MNGVRNTNFWGIATNCMSLGQRTNALGPLCRALTVASATTAMMLYGSDILVSNSQDSLGDRRYAHCQRSCNDRPC